MSNAQILSKLMKLTDAELADLIDDAPLGPRTRMLAEREQAARNA